MNECTNLCNPKYCICVWQKYVNPSLQLLVGALFAVLTLCVYHPYTSAWRDLGPFFLTEQLQLKEVGWLSCINCL